MYYGTEHKTKDLRKNACIFEFVDIEKLVIEFTRFFIIQQNRIFFNSRFRIKS